MLLLHNYDCLFVFITQLPPNQQFFLKALMYFLIKNKTLQCFFLHIHISPVYFTQSTLSGRVSNVCVGKTSWTVENKLKLRYPITTKHCGLKCSWSYVWFILLLKISLRQGDSYVMILIPKMWQRSVAKKLTGNESRIKTCDFLH